MTTLRISAISLAFASALQKSTIYIVTPFIILYFDTEFLGEFTYIYIISQVLSGLIGLNATPVIIRNSNCASKLRELNFFYTLISLGIFLVLSFFIFWDRYYFSFIFFGFSESIFLLLCANLRARDKNLSYLVCNIFKFAILLLCLHFSQSVEQLIYIYSLSVAGSLLLLMSFSLRKLFSWKFLCFKKLFEDVKFGLSLYPHSWGLWLFNSGTRYIIKVTFGAVALGQYSQMIFYASPIILVNSVLTMLLPREIVKSESDYNNRLRNKYLHIYNFSSVILFIGSFIVYSLDANYRVLFDDYSEGDLFVLAVSYISFYSFGLYQFSANQLFYLKKGKTISLNTIVFGGLSFGCCYVIAINYGLMPMLFAFSIFVCLYSISTYVISYGGWQRFSYLFLSNFISLLILSLWMFSI